MAKFVICQYTKNLWLNSEQTVNQHHHFLKSQIWVLLENCILTRWVRCKHCHPKTTSSTSTSSCVFVILWVYVFVSIACVCLYEFIDVMNECQLSRFASWRTRFQTLSIWTTGSYPTWGTDDRCPTPGLVPACTGQYLIGLSKSWFSFSCSGPLAPAYSPDSTTECDVENARLAIGPWSSTFVRISTTPFSTSTSLKFISLM